MTDEDTDIEDWVQRLDFFEDIMHYTFNELTKSPSHLACNSKTHDHGLVDVNDTFAVCGEVAHSHRSSLKDEKVQDIPGMF